MAHKPLLTPGLHEIEESDLDNHFLSSFVGTKTRAVLIQGFKQYLQALRQYGVQFEVWIDGSFATDKQDPSDIDIVVFASGAELNALPLHAQTSLRSLFDRVNIKHTLGCDVFFSVLEDANMRSYWRGWYGFDRDEQPKGIACVRVSP